MSSALPKAVQDQVKAANELLAKMNTPPPAPASAPNPPAGAPPAAVVPPATPPPADDTWQHKYAVLQGKYNAEVPRLQKTLTEQTDLIRDMRQRLTNTETMVAARQLHAAAPPPAPVPSEDLAAEEVETYGEDLVNVMRRISRVEAGKLVPAAVAPVVDRVAKVEQGTSQVSQTVARSSQQETIRLLAAAVPNWAVQDKDPGFLAWLDQVDPFAGVKRGGLLKQAFLANDATRVIAFFQGYSRENAAVQPETPPSTPPATPPAEQQTRMEDLVAPGAPKAPTASAPNDAKRVWTRKDVTDLYAAKNEFIRKGKTLPDELVKAEKDLFAAQHDGRLKNG